MKNKWEEDLEFMTNVKNLVTLLYTIVKTKIESGVPDTIGNKNSIRYVKKFKTESEIMDFLYKNSCMGYIKRVYNVIDIEKGDDILYITFNHKGKKLKTPLIYSFHLGRDSLEFEIWINTYVTQEVK